MPQRMAKARRCLSYLTIEHDGDLPEDIPYGRRVFGCDIFQERCGDAATDGEVFFTHGRGVHADSCPRLREHFLQGSRCRLKPPAQCLVVVGAAGIVGE